MPAKLPRKGPGRPKGSKNKTTVALKQAIMGAFEAAGGQEYLLRVAKEDAKTFCTLLAKVLPAEIKADIEQVTTQFVVMGTQEAKSAEEWEQKHSGPTIQ